MRLSSIAVAVIAASVSIAGLQTASDGPLLGAVAFSPTGSLKIFNNGGSVRLVGWDKDSVVVRGRVPRGEHFTFRPAKAFPVVTLGMIDWSGPDTDRPCDFVVYLPKHATVSAKTVTANIDANNVSGWFYSASGTIHLAGAATSAEVESINGSIDLNLAVGLVRARTGDGHLLLRGSPQDVDVSTISGTLDIAAGSVMRGQFSSVSGDIHYAGSPLAGAIFDFSNHSGAVDLVLAPDVSGVFSLSSVTGAIENGMSLLRPAAAEPSSLRLSFGRGAAGARIAVRTFKGAIRLRPQ